MAPPDPAAGLGPLIARLEACATEQREAAVEAIAHLCEIHADADFDRALAALEHELDMRPHQAGDRGATLRLLLEGRTRVALARGARIGYRVRRPDDLDVMDSSELLWQCAAVAFAAVSIYGDRAELEAGLRYATPGIRAALALHWTFSEVFNGGLPQYFDNPTGIVWPDALAGARLFGVADLADVLERAGAVFPGGRPPPDRDARSAALEAAGEDELERLDALTDEFYGILDAPNCLEQIAAYIRANPDEFFLP